MPASEEQIQWQEELNTDGTKRLPIIFCLDTSGSMRKGLAGGKQTGERVYDEDSNSMCHRVIGGIRALDELNKAMKHFFIAYGIICMHYLLLKLQLLHLMICHMLLEIFVE